MATSHTAKKNKPHSCHLIAPAPLLPGTACSVGIDISKRSFHVCFLTDKDARPVTGEFTADSQGHAKFITWAKRVAKNQAIHFCLEETGIYGRALANFLHEAGHHVSLVNAALIKNHGRALNLRTKNDSVDAWLIAHFTLCHVPARWNPPPAAHQRLRDISRRHRQLGEMIIAEVNHLEAALDEGMRENITHVIELLKKEQTKLWTKMSELVQADAQLQRNAELLKSIPHIGEISTLKLLAELPPLDAFTSARELCAYAGLTPRQEQSGTSVNKRTRLCKQGRVGLRTLMFMPAVSVLSSKSSPFRSFAERLKANQKAGKCVVGALMRKLMSVVFAILRTGKPFDRNYRHPLTQACP